MNIKKMLFQRIGSIKNSILISFIRIWVFIYNLVVHRKFVFPGTNFSRYIFNSSLFSSNTERYYKWDAAWEHSFSLWNRGEYLNAVALRTHVLEDIYSANGVDNPQYSPPFLSHEFSGPFGHNAIIGVHVMAQELNLIPLCKKTLTTFPEISARPFIKNLAPHINVIPHQNPNWNSAPSEWHISERLQVFKTFSGFSDIYPIIERVFHQFYLEGQGGMFDLLPEYEKFAQSELSKYGLSKNDWFATLHVRSTGSANDIREQSIQDYLPAIKHIISSGGKLIRIGDPTMEKLDAMPGLIDLTSNLRVDSLLHLYALAKSKFFIGTNSGPKMYPPLYGVPSLITNLTSIGLETFKLTPGTIYIPKTYLKKGRKLSLVDILGSHLGYDNLDRKQLLERGICVANTSEFDILAGVEEMIDYVFGLEPKRNSRLDMHVEKIRDISPYSSSGLFGSRWLSENESWFLSA